jgi:uncharacterized protein (DUF697 family)
MPAYRDLNTVWSNIKEFELQPIRQAALREVRIALVGASGAGRHTLGNQMRTDPAKPELHSTAPLAILDLEQAVGAEKADLIILVTDVNQTELTNELELVRKWIDVGKKLIIFCNKVDALGNGQVISQWVQWPGVEVLYGSAMDRSYLERDFVQTVLKLLPNQLLALGRMFPLFRLAIAHQLINEACLANATYALSTGLAEIVPVLALPLTLTDIVVLTKNQAFLVYRLGLLFGYSTYWQDYIREFGSVIGGGFAWRQMARYLVGLIPGWGIVPKVAISYSGTYVVGQSVLTWYQTGRHLGRKELNALYRSALTRGKQNAERLVARMPRPHLPRPKKKTPKQLPEGQVAPTKQPRQGRRKMKELPAPAAETIPAVKNCAKCSRSNATDANFCQYCGEKLEAINDKL